MNGPRFARARRATLLLWSVLLAALTAWHLSGRSVLAAATLVLATAAPLAFALPGLWRAQRRSYRWAPLTLAPAMAWSLTELVANPGVRRIAAITALLAFLALAAVVATLRTMPGGR